MLLSTTVLLQSWCHMKNFEIPKQIRVKNAIYNIVFTNTLYPDDEYFTFGLCDPQTRTIYIKKHLTEQQTISTYWHEYFHAVEFEYGVKIGHPMIEILEKAMAHLYRRNAFVLQRKPDNKPDIA